MPLENEIIFNRHHSPVAVTRIEDFNRLVVRHRLLLTMFPSIWEKQTFGLVVEIHVLVKNSQKIHTTIVRYYTLLWPK